MDGQNIVNKQYQFSTKLYYFTWVGMILRKIRKIKIFFNALIVFTIIYLQNGRSFAAVGKFVVSLTDPAKCPLLNVSGSVGAFLLHGRNWHRRQSLFCRLFWWSLTSWNWIVKASRMTPWPVSGDLSASFWESVSFSLPWKPISETVDLDQPWVARILLFQIIISVNINVF